MLKVGERIANSTLNIGVFVRICGCLTAFWSSNACDFNTFRRVFGLRFLVLTFGTRGARRQNRCGNRGKCASTARTRIFRRSHSNHHDRKESSVTPKTPTHFGEEANIEHSTFNIPLRARPEGRKQKAEGRRRRTATFCLLPSAFCLSLTTRDCSVSVSRRGCH
jgi:hypothetical protein